MTGRRLSDEEEGVLREFARGQTSTAELLRRLGGIVKLTRSDVGNREIMTAPLPDGVVRVTRDDILWVVERYLRGKLSGDDLSTWAGLLLAIPAYALPGDGSDDESLIELLGDLAAPMNGQPLDRDVLKGRLQAILSGPR